MAIRDLLARPAGPPLVLGLALLLSALGPAPRARAEQPPAVQALDDALKESLPSPDVADEFKKALDARAKRLKELTDDRSPLKAPGAIAEALLLPTWRDDPTALTGTPEGSEVDRKAREALLERFLGGLQATAKAAAEAREPAVRAAVATLIGEFAASARSGFLGARRGSRLVVDHLGRFTALVAGLAEKDTAPEVRIAAAASLAKLQSDPVKAPGKPDDPEPAVATPLTVPALQALFKDPHPEVRRAAAAALGDLLRGTRAADRGGFSAAAPVVEPPADNLFQFGPQVARAAGAVLKGDESDAPVRRLCADALVQVGTSLNVKLRATDVAAPARGGLRRVVDALWEQTGALSRAAGDADPPVRKAALRALEEMGSVRMHWLSPEPERLPIGPTPDGKPRPLSPRTGLAPTPEEMSGLSLTYAFEQAPPKPTNEPPPLTDAIPALVRALQDDDVRSRLAALDALEAITARSDEKGRAQRTVAQDLGKEATAAAAKALTRALSDPDRFVRWASARTLGKMAPLDDAENGARVERGVVTGLARLLSDTDPTVRLRTAYALEQFGKASREAVPALAVAASRGDVEVRIFAAHAIMVIGGHPEEAVPALAAGLTDPTVRLRRTVAEALASYGADAAAAKPALSRALGDPDAEVRRLAADALLNIGARR